jgi:hypothetical protein
VHVTFHVTAAARHEETQQMGLRFPISLRKKKEKPTDQRHPAQKREEEIE